ncbi:ElyC/SanA/YdcF family protein [Nocardioides nanhaiensis]|uniref:ElyC/SanA/YdcF family protein n=1 Tax=Nocardioides nanhaiensis TaxID=1476871 RepID=A0ABP8VNM1_9ACTN
MLLLAALGVLAGGAVVVSNLVVVLRTGDQVVREPDAVRPAQVAIVPGSLVRPDGSLGDVVQERLDAAVALHEAGTVEKILVSGDNGDPSYNEPDAMRDAALAAGVPAEDVFTDYAGFSTWHTMRRAREVFEVESAVVVTQGFHTARAVDLGVAAGLEVQGLATDDGSHTARELLARVRGLWEATVEPRVTPGDPLPITGDGRTSWAQ